MISSVKQGLDTYKETKRNFLQECAEFDDGTEKNQTEIDVHLEWEKITGAMLQGMELALGLSPKEIDDTTREILSSF